MCAYLGHVEKQAPIPNLDLYVLRQSILFYEILKAFFGEVA